MSLITEEYIKEFIVYLEKKIQHKKRNIDRIKKSFNDENSFNIFMCKILDKHNEELKDKFYKNGIQPHPLNILYSVFDMVENEGNQIKPFDDFTTCFTSYVFEYMNWQFAITHGQGSICSVYFNKELKYRD